MVGPTLVAAVLLSMVLASCVRPPGDRTPARENAAEEARRLPPVAGAPDPWTAVRSGQPPDVLAFLDRLETCHHFAGEEPYDEARRAEILAAMERARCARMDADETRLRTSYAGVPAVLDALERARELAR